MTIKTAKQIIKKQNYILDIKRKNVKNQSTSTKKLSNIKMKYIRKQK